MHPLKLEHEKLRMPAFGRCKLNGKCISSFRRWLAYLRLWWLWKGAFDVVLALVVWRRGKFEARRFAHRVVLGEAHAICRLTYVGKG